MPKSNKTVDRKNKMANFFKDDFRQFVNDDINCHLLCRVTSYDKSNHRCDCQPLPLQSDGDKRAALVECIVPSAIWQLDSTMKKIDQQLKELDKPGFDWQPIAVGSVVWVEFSDRETDNWTGSTNYSITSSRMHSIQDPYVGSVVKP